MANWDIMTDEFSMIPAYVGGLVINYGISYVGIT